MIHCFPFPWASLLNVEQWLPQNCTVRLAYFQMWPFLSKTHVKVTLGYFRNRKDNLILITLMGHLHSVTRKTKVWQGVMLIYPHFMALTAVNRRACVCTHVWVLIPSLSPFCFQLVDYICFPSSLHLGFSPA